MKEVRRLRVLEDGVLRRIFGTNRDEVTIEWRKVHNEYFNVFYLSPNIVRVIKSLKNEISMACSTYGMRRGVYRFWWGYLKERDHFWVPGVDSRILLRWIFRKLGLCVWTGWS